MFRTLLVALASPGLVAATVAPVAIADSQYAAAATFGVAAVILCGIALLGRRFLPSATDPSSPRLLALVAACWIEVALVFGSLTFIAIHVSDGASGATPLRDPMSAVFEAVSGVSTTGLSMLGDSSRADAWLQWWRSAMQWFGAIGVILFAATAAEPSGDHDSLVDTEWGDKPGDSAGQTALRLGTVLSAITLASIGAMLLAGEPAWRALNHGMSAAATGGFAITKDSAAASGGVVQFIIAITLLASSVSYGTIWDRTKRSGVPLWKRTQFRWGGAITGLGLATGLAVAWRDAPVGSLLFNGISASTTGGFAVGDGFATISVLGIITTTAMLIGGAAGSTAGGIKTARVAWIVKSAIRWVPGDSSVDDDKPYTWDDAPVEVSAARHRIMGASAIIATWTIVLLVGIIVLAVSNPSTPGASIVFEAVSAGSGVGMSKGITGSSANGVTKATLTILMLAGRIEMTGFVVLLLSPAIARRRAHA